MAQLPSIRFSLRILRKHAKLACIAVFSLAIGLAAASAGLSAFHALLLRPPAVVDPNRLLTLYTVTPNEPFSEISYPDYRYYRDKNNVFSGLGAIPFSINLRTIIFEQREKGGLVNAVSDNYFAVLGVQPFLGRWFAAGDDVNALLPVLQAYMGHSSIGDTAYYLRLTAESYPHIAAAIQRAFGDIVPPLTAGLCDGD